MAVDLGVLTVSVPLFSLRQQDWNLSGRRGDESGGWRQLDKLKETQEYREKEKRDTKNGEASERDKRNRRVTKGETRGTDVE